MGRASRERERHQRRPTAAAAGVSSPATWAPGLSGVALVVGLVAVGALFLAYANVLEADFIFDDLSVIQRNRTMRGSHADIFSYRPTRFLVNWSFSAQLPEDGVRTTYGFHLVNVLIHLASGVFAFLFVRSVFNSPYYRSEQGQRSPEAWAASWLPFMVAALFLLHPIQTQAVSYIVQRYSEAAGAFSLCSLWLYVRARIAQRESEGNFFSGLALALYGCAALAASGAMLSKETAATLPLSIVLIDACFFEGSLLEALKRRLPVYGMFTAVSALGVLLLFSGGGWRAILASAEPFPFSRMQYAATQLYVIPCVYLKLLAFPLSQSIDHDVHAVGLGLIPGWVFLGACLLGLLLVMNVALYRRSRLAAFCLPWLLIQILITSSIIPIYDLATEHRLYLGSLGWSLLLVIGIAAFCRWFMSLRGGVGGDGRLAGGLLAMLVCLGVGTCYAGLTRIRNQVWSQPLLVWEDVVSKYPKCARAWSSIGMHHLEDGKFAEAVAPISRALHLAPGHPEGWNNLGKAYLELEQFDESEKALLEALRQRPRYDLSCNNLGLVYFKKASQQRQRAAMALKQGNREAAAAARFEASQLLEEALKQLETAVQSNTFYTSAWINLGSVAITASQVQKAIAALERAIELEPRRGVAWYNLGLALIQEGRAAAAARKRDGVDATPADEAQRVAHLERAVEAFGRAHVLAENQIPMVQRNLGQAYFELDRPLPAIEAFQAHLAKVPKDFATLNTVGVLYQGLAKAAAERGSAGAADARKHYTSALDSFERSLSASPQQDKVENLQRRIGNLRQQLQALSGS